MSESSEFAEDVRWRNMSEPRKGRQKVKVDGSPSRIQGHSIGQVEEFVCGANVYAALSGLREFSARYPEI